MSQIKRYEHFIVKFHNHVRPDTPVLNVTQIQPEILLFISYLDYIDIIKPFVCMDLAAGMTRSAASIKYGITEAEARGLGIKIGRFQQKGG